MNCREYLELAPERLLEELEKDFVYDVPFGVESPDDLSLVATYLSTTTNQYSFLMQLSALATVQKRLCARDGDKQRKEDVIDKIYVIDKIVSAVKLRYDTLSRMVTIKQEIDRELNMDRKL